MTTANITLGTAWTQVADSSREFLLTLPGRTRIDVDIATTDDLVAPTVARGHILAADRHGRITRAMVGPGNVWAKTTGPTTVVLDSWNADLATIMQMEGLAGYWPTNAVDPAYLFEDSAGTIPASVGGVVGQVKAFGAGETLGPELSDTLNDIGSWIADGSNDLVAEDGGIKITYVNGSYGAYSNLSLANGLSANLDIGLAYLLTGEAKISSGTAYPNVVNSSNVSVSQGQFTLNSTGYTAFTIAFNPTNATTNRINISGMGAGETVWIKNLSVKKLLTPAAIQSTTANKPYLRRTPTSGVYWLDSNTSTSALNVALSDTALGRCNLLTYTEDFSNAVWPKTSVTATHNAGTAPDGTNTAIVVTSTTANTTNYIQYTPTLALAGQPYTFSFYAKKGVIKYIQATIAGSISASAFANFDLDTGVIGSNFGVTSSITSVGNGWYRCSLYIASASASASTPLSFYVIDAPTDIRAASYMGGAIGDSLYLWHPQFELGTTATDYQRIVSAPAYCTVARATAEGVTFTENSEITPSYNIAPAFGFNSDIAIFNRALTATEKALVTRYMQRGVPVLGANLITNGTFDTDTTGWTAVTSNIASVAGNIRITNSGDNYGKAFISSPGILTTVDSHYLVQGDYTGGTITGTLRAGTSTTGSQLYSGATLSAATTVKAAIKATSTATYLSCNNVLNTDAAYSEWDNAAMKEIL